MVSSVSPWSTRTQTAWPARFGEIADVEVANVKRIECDYVSLENVSHRANSAFTVVPAIRSHVNVFGIAFGAPRTSGVTVPLPVVHIGCLIAEDSAMRLSGDVGRQCVLNITLPEHVGKCRNWRSSLLTSSVRSDSHNCSTNHEWGARCHGI